MEQVITVNLPERKKYTIKVKENEYTICPVFSLRTHREFFSDSENTDYRKQVAIALNSDLCNEENPPSVDDILDDLDDPCAEYIKIVLDSNPKIEEYFETNSVEDNLYYRFYISVQEYDRYVLENLKNSLGRMQQKLNSIVNSVMDCMNRINYNEVFDQFIKTLSDLRKSVIGSFKQIALNFPQIDWERWDKSFRHWGEGGWTVIPNAPIDLFSIEIDEKTERDKLALQYLKKKDIGELFDELLEKI